MNRRGRDAHRSRWRGAGWTSGWAAERSLSQRTDYLIARLIGAVRYDDVTGEQRDEVYRRRHSILTGDGLGDWVRQSIDDVVGSCVADAKPGPDGVEQLWSELADLYPMTVTIAARHSLTGSDRLARFRSERARLFDAMSEQIIRADQAGGCRIPLQPRSDRRTG